MNISWWCLEDEGVKSGNLKAFAVNERGDLIGLRGGFKLEGPVLDFDKYPLLLLEILCLEDMFEDDVVIPILEFPDFDVIFPENINSNFGNLLLDLATCFVGTSVCIWIGGGVTMFLMGEWGETGRGWNGLVMAGNIWWGSGSGEGENGDLPLLERGFKNPFSSVFS